MSGAKPLPIAAAIAGLLAAISISVKLATTSDPLEARADDVLARANKVESTSIEDLQASIGDLNELAKDPGFAKLPTAKQEAVRALLESTTTLKTYKEFEMKVNELPEPKSAHSIAQLKEIGDRWGQLSVSEILLESKRQSEPIQRWKESSEDAHILELAFDHIREDYQKVIDAGKLVLKLKNEPKLPRRIQDVLAQGNTLKTPQNDNDKLLPDSARLTYATVFQMSEMQSLIQEWNKLKETLEPAAKTQK